jgi:hypothetical protein
MNFLRSKTLKKYFAATLFGFAFCATFPQAVFADAFTVSTGYPSELTAFQVVLTGFVTDVHDTTDVYTWFEYGPNGAFNKSTTVNQVFFGEGNMKGVANYLNTNVVYSYRAVAQNKRTGSKVYGEIKTFVVAGQNNSNNNTTSNNTSYTSNSVSNNSTNTNQNQTTNSNSNIGKPITSTVGDSLESSGTSIVLNGMVSLENKPTTGWFQFGETKDFGSETTHKNLTMGTSPVNFSETVSNLKPNTTYYYRAVAETSVGVGYGTVMSFSTTGGSGGGLFGVFFGGGAAKNTNEQDSSSKTLALGEDSNGDVSDQGVAGSLAWGKTLKSQSFTINEDGSMIGVKDGVANTPKGGNALAAVVFSIGSVMPGSFIGWIVWVVILYIIISQIRSISNNKKKAKEESEAREAEMKEMRKKQEEALSKGRKPVAA